MSNRYSELPFGLNLTLPPPLPIPNQTDLLDFQGSGKVETARYINSNTQDFELQGNGLYQGVNSVEQQVQLSISTTFNSSILLNFGQNFQSVKVITPYIIRQMTGLLNQCLSDLIQPNLITILNVTVSANLQGQVLLNFSYTNNTLNSTTQISWQIPST